MKTKTKSKAPKAQGQGRATPPEKTHAGAGKGAFMPFEELEQQWPGGRAQLYRALQQGVFPTIRAGRRFHILREPTERILRGELPQGGQSKV